jgi:hypothetical protein
MKNFMAKQKAKAKKQGTHRGPVAVPRKKRKK